MHRNRTPRMDVETEPIHCSQSALNDQLMMPPGSRLQREKTIQWLEWMEKLAKMRWHWPSKVVGDRSQLPTVSTRVQWSLVLPKQRVAPLTPPRDKSPSLCSPIPRVIIGQGKVRYHCPEGTPKDVRGCDTHSIPATPQWRTDPSLVYCVLMCGFGQP